MGIRKELTHRNGRKVELPNLTKEQILDKINSLQSINPDKTKMHQALVAFLYLSACRVSEVVKYKSNKVLIHPGIRKHDLSFEGAYMDINNVITLKKGKDRKLEIKNIPVNIEKEKEFFDIFFKHYQNVLDFHAVLFPISRQRAYKILTKVGLYNHYMRHLRLTHLATKYHFDSLKLKKYVNWSSSLMADTYVHLDIQDLKDAMNK